MNALRPGVALAVLAGCLLAAPPAGGEEAEPLVARITLKNKQTWNVNVLGRFRNQWLSIRKKDEPGDIQLPLADIGRIDFPLKLDADEVLDLYGGEQYGKVVSLLAGDLRPYFKFVVDMDSNLDAPLAILMKALYWQGKPDKARALAERVLSQTTRDRPWLDATVVKVLCLLEAGEIDEAAATLQTLEDLPPEQASSAMVAYTRARVLMARDERMAAQEALANLIAYRSRDFEWMPAALYLSAEGYARAGSPDVARQVVEEIKLNYPATRWVQLAQSLDVEALAPPPTDPVTE